MGAFSNIKGLTYYGNAEEDPYVTLEAVSLKLFSFFSPSSIRPAFNRNHGEEAMIIIKHYTQIAERSGFSRLGAMRSTLLTTYHLSDLSFSPVSQYPLSFTRH